MSIASNSQAVAASKPPRAAQHNDRDPLTYLGASGLAALINFPLWKAAAIGQSGFATQAKSMLALARTLLGPPYKGVAATLFGMTWARAAIFYGSDVGKDVLVRNGTAASVASWLPSIFISTFVQVANQPIVRGTITIQNPASTHANLGAALVDIYSQRGVRGLWHGTGASVMKTVPKYASAIWVKDVVAGMLPPPPSPAGSKEHRGEVLRRSAVKSMAAGVAGAALTNPLDVIRNEMFKTDEGTVQTVRRLVARDGLAFMQRGLGRNMLAVAAPIGLTIFLTDLRAGRVMSRPARRTPRPWAPRPRVCSPSSVGWTGRGRGGRPDGGGGGPVMTKRTPDPPPSRALAALLTWASRGKRRSDERRPWPTARRRL